MHAVVFQVDMKPGADAELGEQELDKLVAGTRSVPGFVQGIWLSDGARGMSVIVCDSEEVARGIVAHASATRPVSPDAGVSFRSADVFAVVRDVKATAGA
jgi:hypothetical protein